MIVFGNERGYEARTVAVTKPHLFHVEQEILGPVWAAEWAGTVRYGMTIQGAFDSCVRASSVEHNHPGRNWTTPLKKLRFWLNEETLPIRPLYPKPPRST